MVRGEGFSQVRPQMETNLDNRPPKEDPIYAASFISRFPSIPTCRIEFQSSVSEQEVNSGQCRKGRVSMHQILVDIHA